LDSLILRNLCFKYRNTLPFWSIALTKCFTKLGLICRLVTMRKLLLDWPKVNWWHCIALWSVLIEVTIVPFSNAFAKLGCPIHRGNRFHITLMGTPRRSVITFKSVHVCQECSSYWICFTKICLLYNSFMWTACATGTGGYLFPLWSYTALRIQYIGCIHFDRVGQRLPWESPQYYSTKLPSWEKNS
jgi:hypothetical protein